jgi:carboxynorspermidine decarboxylase
LRHPPTPYYVIDEGRLTRNLEIVGRLRASSGARIVLALKCFATWRLFDVLRDHLDGTTSSSPFEAQLGHEEFGKEVHVYSVGFSRDDLIAVRSRADKITFNSVSQLLSLADDAAGVDLGLRINPGVSFSAFDLADPNRRYSRLGVIDEREVEKVASMISGLLFHFNCQNTDVESVDGALDHIGQRFGPLLESMRWVSLGGGISFTDPGYPVDRLGEILRRFSRRHGVQVYLEPGEAIVTSSTELVSTVLDVVHNEMDIAIVDSSVEAHMPDQLILAARSEVTSPGPGRHRVMIAGRTCLAGDVFGVYDLAKPLERGDEVRIADAAAYTIVKKTWFNGIAMPSIVVRRVDGTTEIVRQFDYGDFKRSLS